MGTSGERHPMKRFAVGVVLAGIVATACNYGRVDANETIVASSSPASVTVQSLAPRTPTPSSRDSSPGPSPSLSPSSEDVHPIGWYARVTAIDPVTRARMKYSWHEGCPVLIKNLRLIRMSFFGFDREVHLGEMVVHRTVAGDVVRVFHTMFGARYPIRRMRLIDDYRGNDDRSMAADNTSAFNCRRVTGGSAWSQHSYGWAIDINPVENPYVSSSGKVLPPAGREFVDRSKRARGMIHHGDVVWRAFRSVGWGWGGDWRSFQDYQHFSLTGR
jgi:hypothetical protein